MSGFILQILIILLIYLIVALSLNITLGYAGLLNIGHIGFFGIGAYASAILVKDYGMPFLAGFIGAGVVAGLCGFILMSGIKKLTGDYLALATLGFNFVVFAILINWVGFTGGPIGIAAIPKPNIFGLEIESQSEYLIFALIITGLIFGFIHIITKNRYGRVLEAIRDDELSAMALGKNTHKVKVQAMMISAGLTGLAGCLFAHYISFIDPSIVSIPEIIISLTIVILGGLATNKGAFYATVIIVFLPELLRFLSFPNSVVGPMRQIIYALVLISILMFKPKGLFGKVDLK